jgi:3-hydroxybutyryl-CoA dehydrogenase
MAWPDRIAVVGAGYMGRGIAQVFVQAGIPCTLADISAERAAAAVELLVADAARHESDGLVPPGSSAEARSQLLAADSVADAVSGADYVVESVFEDRGVKVDALMQIDAAASPVAVISTNTSAIAIQELSRGIRDTRRFLGVHWFNPPQFVPGVELIPSRDTSTNVLEAVEGLLARVGKRTARVADTPGFVGNRLQYALFQEAAAIVEEGIASPEIVDEVVRSTFGFRLPIFGPFAIADMAGLDIYSGSYATFVSKFGDRFAVPQILSKLVSSGAYGAKTGSGFVIRSKAQAAAMAARRDRAYVALGKVVDGFEREARGEEAEEPGQPS